MDVYSHLDAVSLGCICSNVIRHFSNRIKMPWQYYELQEPCDYKKFAQGYSRGEQKVIDMQREGRYARR